MPKSYCRQGKVLASVGGPGVSASGMVWSVQGSRIYLEICPDDLCLFFLRRRIDAVDARNSMAPGVESLVSGSHAWEGQFDFFYKDIFGGGGCPSPRGSCLRR
jgi:hypothetical protein